MDQFSLEKKRLVFAKHGNIDKFKLTYSNSLEIPNMNTPHMWDRLNSTSKFDYDSNPMAYDRLQTVSRWIKTNLKNQTHMLDIGIGTCGIEERLFDQRGKLNITGIDISEETVMNAKKKYPSWNFKIMDVAELDFPKQSFDIVICLEVLEHISPSKVLRIYNKILKTLKKSGVLILSVPLNEDLKGLLLKGSNANAHVRDYSPEVLFMELHISGFEVSKVKYLYAFHNWYHWKSLITSFFSWLRRPNNIVVLARRK